MKKTLLILVVLAIIGGIIGYQIYHQPHDDMRAARPDVTINATELYTAYEADESAANQKFLDKKVQVTGTVMSTETDEAGKTGITLEAGGMLGGVVCKLDELADHQRTDFTSGEEVTFKCICTGMLMNVVLERCVEVEPK